MSLLLAIRPQPGLAATIATGRDMGLAITGEPLFEIRATAWEPPPSDQIDALLIGSANAIRHGGRGLESLLAKPAYAVGYTTANAARAAGFAIAGVGEGGFQGLLNQWQGGRARLLRLAGAEHVPLTAPPGCSITMRIVYEAAPLPLPAHVARQLTQGALVLLHSAAAACHFADQCDLAGLERKGIILAALGPRIAAAAGTGWAGVHSAAQPNDLALLAMAKQICQ